MREYWARSTESFRDEAERKVSLVDLCLYNQCVRIRSLQFKVLAERVQDETIIIRRIQDYVEKNGDLLFETLLDWKKRHDAIKWDYIRYP